MPYRNKRPTDKLCGSCQFWGWVGPTHLEKTRLGLNICEIEADRDEAQIVLTHQGYSCKDWSPRRENKRKKQAELSDLSSTPDYW